jgi:hypothetical protein
MMEWDYMFLDSDMWECLHATVSPYVLVLDWRFALHGREPLVIYFRELFCVVFPSQSPTQSQRTCPQAKANLMTGA